MPEETKTPLQKQIELVKKTVDRSPIIVFVLSTIGMLSAGFMAIFWDGFNVVWFIGMLIMVNSTAFSLWWVRTAKAQYGELVEQLAQKS